MNDKIRCEYVSDTDEGRGHTDKEVLDGNVVWCEAEATHVVRPAGDSIKLNPNRPRQKRAVCLAHARYLVGAPSEKRPENARTWEFDASEPEQIVGIDCKVRDDA